MQWLYLTYNHYNTIIKECELFIWKSVKVLVNL